MRKFIKQLFDFEDKVIAILAVFYLIGVFVGCFFQHVENVQAFDSFVSESFLSVFFKNIFCAFLSFVIGYTAFGLPIICFLNFYSGVCLGTVGVYFCFSLGLKGAFLFSFFWFLFAFVNSVCLFFISFSSLRLSLVIHNSLKNSSRIITTDAYAKPHLIRFLFFTFFIFVSSLFQKFIVMNLFNLLF